MSHVECQKPKYLTLGFWISLGIFNFDFGIIFNATFNLEFEILHVSVYTAQRWALTS